jgi:diguanylate cyclase (GGDEF)-like protein/PAS domain S-box-containing protein
MENFLDIRTLSLMMGLVSIILGISMVYLSLYHKTYPGFSLCSIGAICSGIGGMLLCSRGYAPILFSIIFANVLLALFFSFVSWGMEKFSGISIIRWPDYILLFLFICAFTHYTYIQPNIEARIVAISLVFSFFCLKSCWYLICKESQLRSPFLLTTLLFTASWFFIRAMVTLFYPWGIDDFMKAGVFHALAIIVFIGNQILVTVGLILANHKKLETALTDSNKYLSDSEEKFRSLSTAAFEGILIIKEGIVIESNDAFCKTLGYDHSEMTGKNAIDLVVFAEREKVKKKILSGYEQLYESTCLRKDGTTFPVEIHGKMFSYRHEQVRVTAVRDITDRKHVEKALQEANKKLLDLAMQDGLTQIANRRKFDIKLEQEWRRMMRTSQTISLIIFDVDHFKIYNDTYGHQAGDVCLQTVANSAAQLLKRPGDLLARYGGEEFAIILPDTSAKGATKLAETVRSHIHEIEIRHEASPVNEFVTVSCGVASMIPTKSTSTQVLVEIADKALYEAKETGRNKVVARSHH